MEITRRAFIGALAAVPVAACSPESAPVIGESIPLVYVGEQYLNGEMWDVVAPRLPIVCGVLDDSMMPKPPYYRARTEVDVYTYLDNRDVHIFELITA